MTDNRLWVYHADHESKIILRRQLDKHFSAGWRESPALLSGFIKLHSQQIDELTVKHYDSAKERGADIDDKHARRLAVDEYVRHKSKFVDVMNDHANDDEWIKEKRFQLEKELQKDFGHDPDMRKYRGFNGMLKLDKLYRELENGDS